MQHRFAFTSAIHTRKFDKAFEKLRKSGLTWYPWVGKDYESNRLMVIGESNYVNKEIPNEPLDIALQRVGSDEYFERKVVDCLGCCGNQQNKTMNALFKMLAGKGVLQKVFWRLVAMMELLQQPVIGYGWSENKKKPSADQFVEDAKVVMSVMKIIIPTHVLFVGKSVWLAFMKMVKCNGGNVREEYQDVVSRSKNGRKSYIDYGIIAIDDKYKFDYVALDHPGGSFGFQVAEWSKKLHKVKRGFVVRKEK